MATIAEARAATAARIKAREDEAAAEAEAAKPEEAPAEPKSEGGFFSSFFGRAEAIDSVVEGRKENQTTDSDN